MDKVLLVVHLIFAMGIVGLVLLQRSEGGALGMGGSGGGMGGLIGSRAAANFLTRATGVLAGLFFLTSIILSILAGGGPTRSILDAPLVAPNAGAEHAPEMPGEDAATSDGDLAPLLPETPASEAPTAPTVPLDE